MLLWGYTPGDKLLTERNRISCCENIGYVKLVCKNKVTKRWNKEQRVSKMSSKVNGNVTKSKVVNGIIESIRINIQLDTISNIDIENGEARKYLSKPKLSKSTVALRKLRKVRKYESHTMLLAKYYIL